MSCLSVGLSVSSISFSAQADPLMGGEARLLFRDHSEILSGSSGIVGGGFVQQRVLGAQQEFLNLKGVIKDESGQVLNGVSVKVEGSSNLGSKSSDAGNYRIRVRREATIIFSMVGYQTQSLAVGGRDHIDVVLQKTDKQLEETVVTGYTAVRRDNFTGAATTITRKELERFNNNNVFSILQSLEPSLKVDEGSISGSNPNVIPQINIRGAASVGAYAVNVPLVILDGFEVDISTLYDLDVNRIERISILKDASSTSMYGARGGNGVFVIETRMPKDGKFTITYDAKPSLTLVDLSDYNLMNSSQKLAYENLAGIYQSQVTDMPAMDFMRQEYYDNLYAHRLREVQSGVDTYWLKQPVQSTLSVNHSLRLEGGGNDVRYSIDANYNDFKGAMKSSGRKRGGAGFNLIYRIPNRFTFSNKSTYLYTKAYNSPFGSFSEYTNLNPYERIRDEAGNYIVKFSDLGMYDFGSSEVFNPLYNASLPYRDFSTSNLLSNNTMLEWIVNPALKIIGKGVITKTIINSEQYTSPFHSQFFNELDPRKKGSYRIGNGDKMEYEGNLNIQYGKNFGKHQVVFNAIGEIKNSSLEQTSHLLTGFVDDRIISPALSQGYAENSLPAMDYDLIHSIGMMGSVYYNYDNKYNLSATFRRDGSSLFGGKNRFANFWSLGASYNMHKEQWFENDVVSSMRLYANTGINGSDNFKPNMVSTAYNYLSGSYYYRQFAADYLSQGNSSLSWPLVKQLSLGLDLKILKDFINLTASYYSKTTHDMISPITVAPSFGFPDHIFFQNLGKVNNKGFEINTTIKLIDVLEKNFIWNINLGIVQNKSKLMEISDELRSLNESLIIRDNSGNVIQPSSFFEEGESLENIRTVPSMGIDPASGREMFMDRNGQVTYTWNALDQRVSGNLAPDFFGTLGTTISYKSFLLQALFNYTWGGDIYNTTLVNKIENNSPYHNADVRVLEERWKAPGDIALYKSISDQSVTQSSSRFVQQENFLKLTSLNLNYELPGSFIQKFKLQRARLNFSANDVFRMSSVRMERGIDYPYARTYNFGIMIQF